MRSDEDIINTINSYEPLPYTHTELNSPNKNATNYTIIPNSNSKHSENGKPINLKKNIILRKINNLNKIKIDSNSPEKPEKFNSVNSTERIILENEVKNIIYII